MSTLDQRITKSSRAHVQSEAFRLEMCQAAVKMMETGLDDLIEVQKRLVLFIVWKLTNEPELECVNPEQLGAFIFAHQDELNTILSRFNTTAKSVEEIATAIHEASDFTPGGHA